jgi:hypothetical protein
MHRCTSPISGSTYLKPARGGGHGVGFPAPRWVVKHSDRRLLDAPTFDSAPDMVVAKRTAAERTRASATPWRLLAPVHGARRVVIYINS